MSKNTVSVLQTATKYRTGFSFIRRLLEFLVWKYPGTGTEAAVRRADIFTHTLDLILDNHETTSRPRVRKRRERVTLTDILDDEQRDALINFSGKISNKTS